MGLPLQINDSLFFPYNGGQLGTWGLGCGDGSTDDQRWAYVNWCKAHGNDGIIINLANESYVTLFRDGVFMGDVDTAKWLKLKEFCEFLKREGGKIVFCFFDEPQGSGAIYPYHNKEYLWESFFAKACQSLNQYASAYLFSCESNEWCSQEETSQWIKIIKEYAGLIPVSTHGGLYPDGKPFLGGDFVCYETKNHPFKGDAVSVEEMVAEIRGIQQYYPKNFPIWVSEFNIYSAQGVRQANALAAMDGIIGVGGPLK